MNGAPNVAYLGLCERVSLIEQPNMALSWFNLLGLRQAYPSHIYPINIPHSALVLAIHNVRDVEPFNLSIIGPDGNLHGGWDFGTPTIEELAQDYDAQSTLNGAYVPDDFAGWSPYMHALGEFGIITEPGVYKVVFARGEETFILGHIEFVHVPAPPLTVERIAALRSNPASSRWLRVQVGCKYCTGMARAYAGLDRSEAMEKDGYVWYESLSDTFTCKCGKTNTNLRYLRGNLHGLLGQANAHGAVVSSERQYTRQAIENLSARFAKLLDTDPIEEKVQQFITTNTLLLHQFDAVELEPKKPILSKYVTDYVIVSSGGRLVLIEIERPGLPLMTAANKPGAPLNGAVGQVKQWLQELNRDWHAVLRNMDIDPGSITSVRGVVIAGRDKGYSAKQLQALKCWDWGQHISFFTYDDILNGLYNLARDVDNL